jgi:AP-4 complex subunit epsilon-1
MPFTLKDFDYHRFPAPWLQIKLLQILTLLGQNDLKVSEQIYEVLSSTLRRADDTTINIGYAVTYQCVKSIATLYPSQSLLE